MPPPLLFDLDGTIVDSAKGIAKALTEVSVARSGSAVDALRVRELVSLGVETLVRESLGAVARDIATDVAEFREVLADIPHTQDAVYPGVEDCLVALAEAGHRMAIVTNKPEALSVRLINDIGLSHLFHCIVGGDTLSVSKPDPRPLQYALSSLGALAKEGIMIGDSPTDSRAAAAANIPFVLFEGGYAPNECRSDPVHARFASYDELTIVISDLLVLSPAV